MKYSLLLSLLLSSTSLAQIHDVRLSWKPPTQRENGAAFSKEEIAYYLFKLGDNPEEQVDKEFTIRALRVGTYSYVVRVCDVNGLCSRYSSVKTFTVKTPPKKPIYPSAKAM